MSISRSAKVGNKRYFGGYRQVPLDDARELVRQGAGTILDKEVEKQVRDELKADNKPTEPAPKVNGSPTDK